MRIQLRVLGTLERHFGGQQFEVELPCGARLSDLFEWIDHRWGQQLPDLLWDDEGKRFRGSVLVMVQNRDASDEDMILADQQEILLVVVMAGG